jgi:hypothetical protein
MIGLMSLFADVTYWVLLFFAREEIGPGWTRVLIAGWIVLWAITRVFPVVSNLVMAIVAIVDIILLYQIFGDYAVKV